MTKRFPHYPLFLDVEGREAVVVGGGGVAERKIDTLLRHGARVVVVAPDLTPHLEALAGDGAIEARRRPYASAGDLGEAVLVIAATGDPAVNQEIAADSRARGVPVNVIDAPALCDFILPAVIEQGAIQVAVSTGGHSPALARRLKGELQRVAGPEWAEVNEVLGSLREAAKESEMLPTDADRKRFFEAVLDSGVIELLRQGRRREAYEAVAQACATHGVPPSAMIAAELAPA